jgi:hypothetical protein
MTDDETERGHYTLDTGVHWTQSCACKFCSPLLKPTCSDILWIESALFLRSTALFIVDVVNHDGLPRLRSSVPGENAHCPVRWWRNQCVIMR